MFGSSNANDTYNAAASEFSKKIGSTEGMDGGFFGYGGDEKDANCEHFEFSPETKEGVYMNGHGGIAEVPDEEWVDILTSQSIPEVVRQELFDQGFLNVDDVAGIFTEQEAWRAFCLKEVLPKVYTSVASSRLDANPKYGLGRLVFAWRLADAAVQGKVQARATMAEEHMIKQIGKALGVIASGNAQIPITGLFQLSKAVTNIIEKTADVTNENLKGAIFWEWQSIAKESERERRAQRAMEAMEAARLAGEKSAAYKAGLAMIGNTTKGLLQLMLTNWKEALRACQRERAIKERGAKAAMAMIGGNLKALVTFCIQEWKRILFVLKQEKMEEALRNANRLSEEAAKAAALKAGMALAGGTVKTLLK